MSTASPWRSIKKALTSKDDFESTGFLHSSKQSCTKIFKAKPAATIEVFPVTKESSLSYW